MEKNIKKQIRAEVKARRKEAQLQDITEKSFRICHSFCSLSEYREAEFVFAYIDCKNEVQTAEIIKRCRIDGKRVAVPKVFGKIMKFYEIFSDDDLEEGYFGIREPKYLQLEETVVENGLMILPGIAFDLQKHRVGYGGGFYDKYLSEHSGMKKVALAFEFQIYEEVPFETFDILPDKIITETRIII